ncbi:glycosyl hydrolase [Flavilitoribacter nigricans]|uniref:Glycoside hydrolase n=1 Tax=Flavilitoribacter nigricans (strain ATCC 23147 / DSM 23189 / NBRC 102662 / NCIMB 1420 / SS-2) TaxID=1122177 RepID=A0A2D0N5W0_FLAN2|nr:glycosyl hydrolase [Flavilitoribacter nigricans]PHN03780.1 glycoside hydrolase [Flavilitoribacter nigricans DSM 23189 = NBRC 102662]
MKNDSPVTLIIALIFLLFPLSQVIAQPAFPPAAEITSTTKPWTRWWWMGSAIDQKNIRNTLIAYDKAGLGGVEITPIYGVKGEEANFLDYLSPQWMNMLAYTIATADSLGMQVDMNLGTGWPFGGPQVSPEYAATKLIVDQQQVRKGEKLKLQIVPQEEKNRGSAQLDHVLAFGDDGRYVDLTNKLKDGVLRWKARKTDYTLYSVFTGKTRQQVKRAAPGGKGFTLDHYSTAALNSYVQRFDSAFASLGGKPRAIFNDSYEVYGTDFTPEFFQAFRERRGYDLKPHLKELVSTGDEEIGNRIRSDYRQTLSDLLLTEFNRPWTDWANHRQFKTRLQAHGSPGNLIDLYASADIPECETFGSMPYDIPGLRREAADIRAGDADAVMLKFSSSAAHIAGKPLTSSETFTWLRDHFKTALSQCKPELEDLFLNGVNHIFLHGSTYSPDRAAWPGWKFYASVNFHPNNTIWADVPGLFSYIANCQSLLQLGTPDNEVLLYWPVYDVWDDYLKGSLFFQFKIHSLDEWLLHTKFYETANRLMGKGYSVDFISDDFISQAKVENGLLVLPGGTYKSMVIPDSDKMPLATLEKLVALKRAGANIIFAGLPESVPGFNRYQEQNETLTKLISDNRDQTQVAADPLTALNAAGIYPEALVESGLKFIRRSHDGEKIYYLVNHTPRTVDTSIPLAWTTDAVTVHDPLTGRSGRAAIRKDGSTTWVKVNIPSGRSLFLSTGKTAERSDWAYYETTGDAVPLAGEWEVNFLEGGPSLPAKTTVTELGSWTEISQDAEYFSGTAQYTLHFDRPDTAADNWQLDLGDVRESARVWLNDTYLGTAWSVPFTLKTGPLLDKNKLVIQVTNLAANRVRAKEMRGEEWKIFHEINMVNKDYQPFDATKWDPMPSGLLGKVTISPLQRVEN